MACPLVSIGLPTYNGSRTIMQALDTLLAQTYKNFELIISDNASTDETEKICREYKTRDSRIRYIRQKENTGGANFNFLATAARGEYFMWAADDDLWEPDFIHDLMELHRKNTQAVVTFCAYDNISFSGEILKRNESILFPEHEHLDPYRRFKKFLLDKGGKCNYTYGIFNKKYLRGWEGFKQFDGIPGQYSSADTFFLLEMLLKGPFVSAAKLLWHKRCNGDDFKPERTVKNLSVFNDRKILTRKIFHFLKTPFYAFHTYRVVSTMVQKSFPSLFDRTRLYFFNVYVLLYFCIGRFFRILKLLFYFLAGIMDIVKKRAKRQL